MNMSKFRDIQAKMPSPKVIFYAFWLVTVKVLNSYEYRKRVTVQNRCEQKRKELTYGYKILSCC